MPTSIALMHSQAHYKAFENSPDFDETTLIVTPDILFADHLKGRGQPHVEIWDFLKSSDIDLAINQCRELSGSWWRRDFSGIVHQGVDLCDAIQRDMWFFFIETLLAKTILNRIINRFSPTSVQLFKEEPEPKFWEGSGNRPHFFNAVAFFLCRKKGIECKNISGCLTEESAMNNKKAPEKSGPLPEWPYGLRSKPKAKNILFYFTEVDYRKHAKFLSALDRSKDFKCHLLRNTNYNAPEFENRGIIWGNVIDWFTLPRNLEQEINQRFHEFERKPHPLADDFGYIFANQHMRFQFKGVMENIKRAARIASAVELLMDAIRPALSISGIDTFGQGYIWNRIAEKHEVPTLAFPHGSIGSRFYTYEKYHSEARHIAVEGDYARKMFMSFGRPENEIKVVGAGYPGISQGANPSKKTKHRVLLMTLTAAFTLATPTASASVLRRQWPKILKGIEERPELAFEIKPHPRYDYYGLYEEIVANGPDNLKISGQSSLEQALGGTVAAILVGPPSTAVLVAMLAGVPAIHLNGSAYEAKGLETCLDQSGLIQAPTPEEAFEALDNLLNDKAFAANHLEQVAKFLPQMTRPGSPKQVTARCMALAERLAAKPGRGYDAATLEQVKRIWTLRHCLDAGDREGVTRELEKIGKEHPEAVESILCRNALASLGGRPY